MNWSTSIEGGQAFLKFKKKTRLNLLIHEKSSSGVKRNGLDFGRKMKP